MPYLTKSFQIILIFVLSFTLFIFILYSYNNDQILHSKSYFEDTSERENCQVPKLNPWDPTIIKLISHPNDLSCIQSQPNLTFIDYHGYLLYNKSEFKRINESGLPFLCLYRTFDRCIDDDDCIKYAETVPLSEPIRLTEDFVEVKCSFDNKTAFYMNVHAHPAQTHDRIFAKPTEEQLSVLLLIIDSTGYSVLQRNMPLTYNYTKNVMGIKYFEAYNKIGDNSFPNMMAMLTGKRVFDEQDDMMREIDFNYGEVKHDTFPLIWKMFSGKGYATAYNEDVPQWGLFHYLAKGFKKKPVDFFYHTYWRSILNSFNKNHTDYCFANIPRPQLQIDLTKRHVIAMNDKLNFLYSHSVEITHDYSNEVERLDQPFLQLFKELYEGNHLNKTVVIFASDHGHRFSSARATIVGLLEERLPFYGLWFPSWFYKLHPHIEKNIDSNRRILSSNFDVYETMKDVLDSNYDGVQKKLTSRGLSQLYPLPKERTCKSAGIPDHYCTCAHEKTLAINHTAATEAASSLVDTLNNKLKNFTAICSTIKLTKILYAIQIDFDDKVKKGVKGYESLKEYEGKVKDKPRRIDIVDKIRIGIETEPFSSRFEALLLNMTTKISNSAWILDGGISRINSYAGLSNCLKNKELEKYCACKVVNLNVTNK